MPIRPRRRPSSPSPGGEAGSAYPPKPVRGLPRTQARVTQSSPLEEPPFSTLSKGRGRLRRTRRKSVRGLPLAHPPPATTMAARPTPAPPLFTLSKGRGRRRCTHRQSVRGLPRTQARVTQSSPLEEPPIFTLSWGRGRRRPRHSVRGPPPRHPVLIFRRAGVPHPPVFVLSPPPPLSLLSPLPSPLLAPLTSHFSALTPRFALSGVGAAFQTGLFLATTPATPSTPVSLRRTLAIPGNPA